MTDTHCPYCALQCGITLESNQQDHGTEPVSLRGRDFETNGGALCRKGYSAATLLDHPERLQSPLLRQPDGSFAPVSWEHALDLVAEKALGIRAESGANTLAV
ncbi:MAG: molybdopterin-dependent oxidoreductase, partial [Glutamicibacter sp.]